MYEPKKIRGTLIPFGYKKSEDDPKIVLPIPEELDVLQEAIKLHKKGQSLQKCVDYIYSKTKRKITRQGFYKIVNKNNIKKKARESAREQLDYQRDRVLKAKRELDKERSKLQTKNKKIKDLDIVLEGKVKTVIDTKDIEEASPTIKKAFEEKDVIFQPNQGPQSDFLASSEREVFYGGARGGGKSYAMLVDPLRYCDKQHHRALLIRRTMPELRDLINHSQQLYSKAYPGAKWREQEKEWRFPSGARIEFGYAENLTDALRYQGQSYTWIGIDELPQYPTPDIYNFLRSSLRSVDPEIPVYMRATGNPGNVGSLWVKEMFVDPCESNKRFDVEIPTPMGVKKISRKFIPAKLQDNPYLMQTDDYYAMLASLPEVQKKQFLEGDWDAYESSSFPEFNRQIHVIEPFDIPRNWMRFRAADWGYSSPACCLWFAVDYDNNLFVYRELYTKRNTADIFARKVLEMEDGEYIRYGILDSSTWARRGDIGPSIAETMIQEGCRWRQSDRSPRSRIAGKVEVHKRLRVDEDTGYPSMFIFSNCLNLIRTLPMLPVDKNNPEDVDTTADDHAYDALRYGCMSRPIHPVSQRGNDFLTSTERQDSAPADSIFGY
jgi:hypothetical protein|tara:strand:- start:339 stop:2156 length:1818 start_codon:yes stop_codon:yes gene_type:complete